MATERAERNYKLKSGAANLSSCSGFARGKARAALLVDPCIDATTSRSSKHLIWGSPEITYRHTAAHKTPGRTRSKSSVEHGESAREVLSDTADGPCKSSSSDAPFGCIAVPPCLPSRRRAPRKRWRKARVTLDRHQTTAATESSYGDMSARRGRDAPTACLVEPTAESSYGDI